MYFTPKKTIPPVAAAGLALAGCGDLSEFQQALNRMDRFDPLVTAFCMKAVECYPDYYYYGVDYCRVWGLYYADTVIQLSDDPAACYDAGRSYFECFERAACGTADVVCSDQYAAFEAACYYAGYYAGEEVQ